MLEYFVPVGHPVKLETGSQNFMTSGSMSRFTTWGQMYDEISKAALEARQLYSENRPDNLAFTSSEAASLSLSRVRRPVLAQAVDATIAQQHLSSFPSDERFFKAHSLLPASPDRLTCYEKSVEARLVKNDFMLDHLKNRKNKMLDCASAVWHPFIRDRKKKTIYQFHKLFGINLPIKPKAVKKEVVTLEFTGFVPLSFEDWKINPKVDKLEDTNFIFRRWVLPEQIQNVKEFENTDDVVPFANKDASFDPSASNKNINYEYMGISTGAEQLGATHALYWEEWGDFYDEDGNFYENHVLIFSNTGTFHYFGENPYNHQKKPFTLAPYIDMPGTLLGKSLAQDIIPLCHALDTSLNQEIDILNRCSYPTFTYLANDEALTEFMSQGPKTLVPGEGIPVRQHESIRVLSWDLSGISVAENVQQRLKEEIRESTGGVAYATGGASELDQERTATETNALVSGTSTRFQLLIQIDEEKVLKPYLEMIFENDRQFLTRPLFVEDEEYPLMPNEIKQMDISFDVTGSKSIMERARAKRDFDNFMSVGLPQLLAAKNEAGAPLAKTNGDIPVFNIPEMLKMSFAMGAIRNEQAFMDVETIQEQEEEIQYEPAGLQPPLGAAEGGGMGAIAGNAGLANPQVPVAQ